MDKFYKKLEEKKKQDAKKVVLAPANALEEDKKKLNQQANVFIPEIKGSVSKRDLITKKSSVPNLMTANNSFKVATHSSNMGLPSKSMPADENIDVLIVLNEDSTEKNEDYSKDENFEE